MAQKLVDDYPRPTGIAVREATADLDNKFYVVRLNGSDAGKCIICSTAGERPLGVIDRNYDAGENCSVQTSGVVTVTAGAAITAGAEGAVDASGRVITATAAHEWTLGRVLTTASAAGDLVSVFIDIRPVDTAALLGYGLKVMKTRVSALSSGFAAETDLFTLPTLAIVVDAFVNVIAAEATGATKTLDLGTSTVSNDPDGFLDGVSVAATGIVKAVATYTTGSNEVYFASSTYGDLLAPTQVAGSDAVEDTGTYDEGKNDITSFAAVVSASPGSADFAELVADIYTVYYELG